MNNFDRYIEIEKKEYRQSWQHHGHYHEVSFNYYEFREGFSTN